MLLNAYTYHASGLIFMLRLLLESHEDGLEWEGALKSPNSSGDEPNLDDPSFSGWTFRLLHRRVNVCLNFSDLHIGGFDVFHAYITSQIPVFLVWTKGGLNGE